ncbi:glycosyltransferase family 2 protein [Algoriphagus lacus]|uniref:glycosyltransferase family 2 protein n=1 Tax=Algoriphagus lacus TaxID=2056311 RepID=UPI001314AC3B|nr:glycosyltransferase [Algoriphagus lacus]
MNIFPLVSVCIPVFNGDEFLLEALESVKIQTYSNLEFIISDDQSNDRSIEIIEHFLRENHFPFTLVTNIDRGIGKNWNNCVRHATGKYIKFLFQDDVLFPECISDMVAMAESDDEVGLVYSDRRILMDETNLAHVNWYNANGELNHKWADPLETGIYLGKRILKDRNLFFVKPWNKLGEPSTMLFRKSVFENVGLFDTQLIQFLDLEFSLRVFSKYKFGYIQKQLTGFRLHENQSSCSFSKKKINERSILLRKLSFDLFFQLGWFSKKIILAEYSPAWVLNLIKKRNRV